MLALSFVPPSICTMVVHEMARKGGRKANWKGRDKRWGIGPPCGPSFGTLVCYMDWRQGGNRRGNKKGKGSENERADKVGGKEKSRTNCKQTNGERWGKKRRGSAIASSSGVAPPFLGILCRLYTGTMHCLLHTVYDCTYFEAFAKFPVRILS